MTGVSGQSQRTNRALLLLLAVAALIRVLALVFFEGDMHDGLTRVGTALAWLDGEREIFGRTVWPEGNYLLPAAALSIWRDVYWAPRVLYAAVGVTNVWLAYLLGTQVFGRSAGLATGWIVALMPFHVMVSANAAMSEGPYIAFILLALLAAARYAERPRPAMALATGVALTLATTFRIDGVVWGVPLAMGIAYASARAGMRPRLTVRDLAIYGIAGLLYPVALAATWWHLYPGDSGHILAEAKLNTQQFFVDGRHPRWPHAAYQTYTILFWPLSILVILTPVIAAVSLVGVGRALLERSVKAAPLVFALLLVLSWLAYAAFKHEILAQWRYALVFAVTLSVFFWPGLNAVAARWRPLTVGRVAASAVIAAAAVQAAITYVTYVDYGAVSRQLSVISPIRPSQFAGRAFIEWAENTTQTVLLTPHVLEQPYLSMNRGRLEKQGVFLVQSYYLPESQLVHTQESLKSSLVDSLARVRYVATSTSLRELGLRDGAMVRELIRPVCLSDASPACVWAGVELRKVSVFGNIGVWAVGTQRNSAALSGMVSEPPWNE